MGKFEKILMFLVVFGLVSGCQQVTNENPPVVTPTTFSVTFDVNGGSAITALTGIANGAKITKPSDPTKDNKVFGDWYKESDFKTKWDFSVDTVTKDITLYAKWNDVVITPTTFSVDFQENGGDAVADLTGITSGSKITKPTDPYLTGYKLEGWYKESDFQTKWDFDVDTVTSNMTLYAHWIKKASNTGTLSDPSAYTLTINGDTNLKFKTESTFTLNYNGNASSYAWWIDDNVLSGKNESTLKLTPTTSTITYGSHVLTVFVKDVNGIEYSGNITINVTN